MAKKKITLRPELVDAGIVYAYHRPISRFMHGVREVDLEKCTVNRALAAAKDPRCKVLNYQKPPKTSKKATSE